MIFRSIKWSLQLWHGIILLLVLAGFGYSAFELQRTREFQRVDEELTERMARLFGPMRPPGQGPGGRPARAGTVEERRRRGDVRRDFPEELPPTIDRSFLETYDGPLYHVIWRRDGRVVRTEELPDGLSRPEPRFAGVRLRGKFREVIRVTPRGDTILVGRSIEPELTHLHHLRLILFASGGGILLLGLAGGWIVANRAMRPVETIGSTALKISRGDLSQRIPQEETESELGRLVTVLNSTFSRLEAAFSEQGRFTADVSHELRTPVSIIVSQTQTALARERSAAEYRETIEACQRAAERMRGLIESLLQLARLDAGEEQLRREPFDMAAVVREAIELLAPLAEQQEVKIVSNLAAARARGDSERIGQVITNLVTNAIRFTPKGGTVTVAIAMPSKGLVELKVSDTGCGIPSEHLPYIFDRFYRVEASRSRQKGGSGLGLAISKAIISAHSGTIDVSSQTGGGTTFTVRLPKETAD